MNNPREIFTVIGINHSNKIHFQTYSGRVFDTQADAQEFIDNKPNTHYEYHILKTVSVDNSKISSVWPAEYYRTTSGARRRR